MLGGTFLRLGILIERLGIPPETLCWTRTRQLTPSPWRKSTGILLLHLVEVEGQQELLEFRGMREGR